MTPTEFEILTQRLIANKLKQEFGFDIPVDHLRTFTSLTGNTYEIDISYTFSLFDINYVTLVECKHWNSYVTRGKIGYFKSIIDDLKAHKGIIVTTNGFQKGAIAYAKSQNIGLIKITNDKYFEINSHFDGGLALIDELLMREDIFNETISHTSVGLFSPESNIYDFIRIHYGAELADFLENDFSLDILDDHYPEINPIVMEQLRKIPDTWYDNYIRFETAGLNYKIQNEPELRIANRIISLLKLGQINNR